MMMNVKEAAAKWNTSCRNVQDLCRRGRIEGAERIGRDWLIPKGAKRPADGRRKGGAAPAAPLIRRTPFLVMTDLYNRVGQADACADGFPCQEEARRLFEAEIACCRGELESAREHSDYFLESHSGFYATISGGMLLAQCAMWQGDFALWQAARRHICEAPCGAASDHDVIALSLAATDSMVRRTEEYPEWFRRGDFERLHPDAYPAAAVYYGKYLLTTAHDLAIGKVQMEGLSGMALMRTVPLVLQPMISHAVAGEMVMVEIYLRLIVAVAHLQYGDRERAAKELDRAIELCLADRLFAPLAEHRRLLGVFLDERISLQSEAAVKAVKELYKKLQSGWVKLCNDIAQSEISLSLSARELEVAHLVAYGLTNAEIAQRLTISLHTVRALLNSVKNKTGALSRSEIAKYI